MAIIYKLLSADEWAKFMRDGVFHGAEIDRQDGFIHFSYAHQVHETARKHFRNTPDLMLLACDRARLGPALKDEVSRGGDLFPHLFRALASADVLWSRPAPLGPEGVPVIALSER